MEEDFIISISPVSWLGFTSKRFDGVWQQNMSATQIREEIAKSKFEQRRKRKMRKSISILFLVMMLVAVSMSSVFAERKLAGGCVDNGFFLDVSADSALRESIVVNSLDRFTLDETLRNYGIDPLYESSIMRTGNEGERLFMIPTSRDTRVSETSVLLVFQESDYLSDVVVMEFREEDSQTFFEITSVDGSYGMSVNLTTREESSFGFDTNERASFKEKLKCSWDAIWKGLVAENISIGSIICNLSTIAQSCVVMPTGCLSAIIGTLGSVSCATGVDIMLKVAGCWIGGETEPPKFKSFSPKNGATVSGSEVQISVSASDNSGVARISVVVDGNLIFEKENASTLSEKWDSTSVANGEHYVVFTVADSNGNSVDEQVTVNVKNDKQEKSEMTNPTPGSTLTSSTVTFTRTDVGVQYYHLRVGKTQGGYDYLNDEFSTSTRTVSGLPTDGSTIHVRLGTYNTSKGWEFNYYTYKAKSNDKPSKAAELTSPTPGSTLTSSTVTFIRTDVGASKYYLYVGTKKGGDSIYGGYFNGTSQEVSGLPTDGSTIYVRLHSWVSNIWHYIDYTYKAKSNDKPSKTAELTSPTPGSTFTSATVTFRWTNVGAQDYHLRVGKTKGGYGYYNNHLGNSTSTTVSGLPTDGSTVHIRLGAYISGKSEFNYYT